MTSMANDELANYYFGKPVYKTYLDKFAGHSYLVKVKFEGIGYFLSDAITVVHKDTRTGAEKAADYISTAGEIISTTQLAIEGSNPVGWIAFALTSVPKLGKTSSEIQWVFKLDVSGFPQENDNNAIMGG